MLRLIGRRLLVSVPLLFITSILVFALGSVVPGDAALVYFGGVATPEQLEVLRGKLGLSDPFWLQYWRWLSGLLHGSLGTSIFGSGDVLAAIAQRAGVSFAIIIGSVVTCGILGISLGVFSAVRGGRIARVLDVLAIATFGFPTFWLAVLLVFVFALKIRWFPVSGYTPPSDDVALWLKGLVLPIAALALHSVVVVARQTRDAMLDALSQPFVRSLRAWGVGERSIIWRHVLRNAAIPVVTVIGLQFIHLLGGSVVVENVFALPGLGSLLVLGVQRHDIPMVQGVTVVFTGVVVVTNLLLDLLYGWLNPRVRVS